MTEEAPPSERPRSSPPDDRLVGEFVVQPTQLRFGAAGDYLVQVGSALRTRLGRTAVLTPTTVDSSTPPRPVAGKVAPNVQVAPGEIHVDQTLREAMLVRPGDRVLLYQAPEESWWRLLLNRVFQPKQLWAYAFRSFPRDMEKGMCGLNAETTALLGLEPRDRVRVEAVRWEEATHRFTVNTARPSVLEFSPEDAQYTRNEVRELSEGGPASSNLGALSVFREDDPGRPRLPFVRLDFDTRLIVANRDMPERRRAQERGLGGPTANLRELELLAPVRLSVSLTDVLRARAVYHVLNAAIGILATAIAAAEINVLVGALAGSLYLFVVVPLLVVWDIRRKVS